MAICLPCIGLGCDNPPDLESGIDNAIFSILDYAFEVQCPPGCVCPAGLFPQVITILASTIPPVIPPIGIVGDPIILRLQGCQSLITRTLDSTATQDEIEAAAHAIQAEWAGQQATCNALQLPGVNCSTGQGFITVCNDTQIVPCYDGNTYTTPAGTLCQQLNITGLNADQIAQATALIKARLNANAQKKFCIFNGIICPISVTFDNIGSGVTSVIIHNVDTIAFDTSSFQLCNAGGGSCFNSVQPSCPPTSSTLAISVSPFNIACTVKFLGSIIFSNPQNNTGLNRTITIEVGCGGH